MLVHVTSRCPVRVAGLCCEAQLPVLAASSRCEFMLSAPSVRPRCRSLLEGCVASSCYQPLLQARQQVHVASTCSWILLQAPAASRCCNFLMPLPVATTCCQPRHPPTLWVVVFTLRAPPPARACMRGGFFYEKCCRLGQCSNAAGLMPASHCSTC